MSQHRVILASGSPRRSQLLADAGVDFEVRTPDIDETPLPDETPTAYVARLSAQKAGAVARSDEVVIAADTTVEIDGRILEKPVDADDARRMLRSLSNRTHHAHTGVTVQRPDGAETRVVTTSVTFVELDDAQIDWYIGTGEPMDKAGAYAIQGRAAGFVERIDGSVTNVVGLPLAETLAMLNTARISGWHSRPPVANRRAVP
jgi:septum formation protein